MEADATALGDERWLALILAWRSECLRHVGEPAAATTAGERALGMLRSQGADAVDLAAASFQLALTYSAQGRYRAAAQLLGASGRPLKAVPLEQQLRSADIRLPKMLGWQAICLATLGEFGEAVARGTEAVAPAEAPGFVARPLGLIVGLNGLGVTLKSFEQALALADELGMRPLVAHCHLGLGKLYCRTDKREQAREHLATATTMYCEMDMRFWLEKAEGESELT
jgi:tetratricopeptide (TPR) repeat protein